MPYNHQKINAFKALAQHGLSLLVALNMSVKMAVRKLVADKGTQPRALRISFTLTSPNIILSTKINFDQSSGRCLIRSRKLVSTL